MIFASPKSVILMFVFGVEESPPAFESRMFSGIRASSRAQQEYVSRPRITKLGHRLKTSERASEREREKETETESERERQSERGGRCCTWFQVPVHDPLRVQEPERAHQLAHKILPARLRVRPVVDHVVEELPALDQLHHHVPTHDRVPTDHPRHFSRRHASSSVYRHFRR